MTRKDQQREQSMTEEELEKEFKRLKKRGTQLKKDLEKWERQRQVTKAGLQDEGGIKGEPDSLHVLGRTISTASSSLRNLSDLLHSAAVEVTKDGIAVRELLSQNKGLAKEYQGILGKAKKSLQKRKKREIAPPDETLDALTKILDRYLEDLEKELEEKKAPAVPEKPAPKAKKPVEKLEKKAIEPVAPDYSSMNWTDLQKRASKRGLQVIGKGVTKDKIIADLKARDRGEIVAPAKEEKPGRGVEEKKKAPAVPKRRPAG